MNRRGLKWAAAGTVGLVLVVLGIHFAWERHRCLLETPGGTLWVGMPKESVAAVLARANGNLTDILPPPGWQPTEVWILEGGSASVCDDDTGRVTGAWIHIIEWGEGYIPRP